jgi:hypothetical protein
MKSLLVSLIGIVAATVAAGASVTTPAGFNEVVTESSLIVRGHVTATRTIVGSAGEIATVATVAVDRVLKGTASAFVSVLVPGGDLGSTRVVMVGAPALRVNDAAVFCLGRGADGLWRPVGLASGIFRVRPDPATGRAVVNAPVTVSSASAGPVVRGNVSRRPLTVPEFESLVRLSLARRTAQPRVRR